MQTDLKGKEFQYDDQVFLESSKIDVKFECFALGNIFSDFLPAQVIVDSLHLLMFLGQCFLFVTWCVVLKCCQV